MGIRKGNRRHGLIIIFSVPRWFSISTKSPKIHLHIRIYVPTEQEQNNISQRSCKDTNSSAQSCPRLDCGCTLDGPRAFFERVSSAEGGTFPLNERRIERVDVGVPSQLERSSAWVDSECVAARNSVTHQERVCTLRTVTGDEEVMVEIGADMECVWNTES